MLKEFAPIFHARIADTGVHLLLPQNSSEQIQRRLLMGRDTSQHLFFFYFLELILLLLIMTLNEHSPGSRTIKMTESELRVKG